MYHYSWLQLIPGLGDGSFLKPLGLEDQVVTVLSTWLVCIMLIGLALMARAGLSRARSSGGTLQFVPDSGLSFRNMLEMYTGAILNLSKGVLGATDARRFFPIVGCLFIYIFFCNLMTVVPGCAPPTDNVSNNFAMALCVFLVFNAAGFARQGTGYIKHMAGPVWWLSWLILPIELVGIVVRPISLSLRLAGNITGDHTVFGIMSELLPYVVPSVFLALGIFVSFLQAFVFTLLTTIYVGLSIAHD